MLHEDHEEGTEITKKIQEKRQNKKYVMLYASSRIDSHISAACYKVSILPEKLY